jgi:hypothetical protein
MREAREPCPLACSRNVGRPCQSSVHSENVKPSDDHSEDMQQRDWTLLSRNLDMC